MTVANGTVDEFGTFTVGTPQNLEFTPAAAARGIVVAPVITGAVDDQFTGITVEGVAMTRIDFAVDAVGETGRAEVWFLSGSFAGGVAQTIQITTTGGAGNKWAGVASVTAAAAIEIVTFAKLEGDQANPQSALDTGAISALRMAIIFSGHDTQAALAELAGMEASAAVGLHDFGTQVAKLGRQTTASTGSFTIGWTAISEDVAMVAVAIQEAGGGAVTGTIAATQDAQTAAISGTVANPVTGTVAASQADQTAAFAGTVTVQITGTIAASQVDQTAIFTGTVANPVTGSIAVTQSDQTMVASGLLTITGTFTATQDAQTAAFTGIVANPVTGTIGVTQANQTAAFVGFMGDITFWQPNPVVYTRNPVAYVPVGADDDPPW